MVLLYGDLYSTLARRIKPLPSGTPTGGQDQFRAPEEKDLPDLYRLDHEAFGETEGYDYLFLRQLFDIHRRDFILLEHDGALRGYALPVHISGEDHASLLALGVFPEFQGKGLGRALLIDALRRSKATGARRMNLVVRPDNAPARHLYEACGFRDVGFVKDYYGPGRDRVLMTLVFD
ncbi:GNAT family N-acetyltransferase [Streptomyces sp. NPDC050528]|uniref:GNAT family N-acetyltransferase n=1 Tax=unclassified Streptomyces TaxID=2593676 RepID=UPI0037B1D0D9